MKKTNLSTFLAAFLLISRVVSAGESDGYSVRQITFGPNHHFFGYIGHVGTIPWNETGRYLVALRVGFQDRMPTASDAAEIVLIDTHQDYTARVVDKTLAWNPQQGTMLYWNPQAPETQFFFNDRDPDSGKVFTVLFDTSKGSAGERITEFRFEDTPFANSGVAQQGGFFLGINYARLARLRPVTGYPDTFDWTVGKAAPEDDGIFLVNSNDGKQRLLVSYAQLRDKLQETVPAVKDASLFINHTLWNRADDRVFLFVRGNFRSELLKIDIPLTIDPWAEDPAQTLEIQQPIGGHPEWENGHTLIGNVGDRQVLYDSDTKQVVGQLGSPEFFPHPGGDIALSADGKRFVNGYGYKQPGVNYYAILSREDNRLIRTQAFSRGEQVSGSLRIDPAPRWNRQGNQILISAITDDAKPTRQLFLITLKGN
ncbi:hypothetical protein OAS39_03830 [Pirellulales bacterium]|nr:hypothetical protein [Pirellulales bacterium]